MTKIGLPKERDERFVAFFQRYPFVVIDEDHVRVRAYFGWQNEGHREQSNEVGDWMAAEWEETLKQVVRRVGFPEGSLNFVQSYRPITSHAFTYGDSRQVMLGQSGDAQVCTLCGRSRPQTTFRSVAHLIPESLGNKNLKTREECDDCNSKFGNSQENELASLLRPELALARIPGKGGPPKHSLGSGRAFVGGSRRHEPITVAVKEDDPSVQVQYTAEGLTLVVPGVTFRPMGAMRSLARIAWHLLGRERQGRHQALREWIRSEVDSGAMSLYHLFIPGYGLSSVGAVVWEHQDPAADIPLVVMVFTGMSILVLPLPAVPSKGNGAVALLPPLPRTPNATITRITGTGEGVARTKNSTFDVVIGGDVFVLQQNVKLPVRFTAKDLEVKGELEVVSSDDERVNYTIQLGGGTLALEVDRKSRKVDLQVSTDLAAVPIAQVIDLLALMTAVHGEEPVTLGAEEGRGPARMFTLGNNPEPAGEAWTHGLQLARAIAVISDEFKVDLRYPAEPDDHDVTGYFILEHAIRRGRVVFSQPGRFSVDLPWLQVQSLKKHIEEAHGRGIILTSRSICHLGGIDLPVGEVTMTIFNARVSNPLPEIETGSVLVELEYDQLVQDYPRWRKSASASQEPTSGA